MYKCDICGRQIFKKNKVKGYVLCSKHMHQLLKYNKFLDNCPRTQNDLNEFFVKGEFTVFYLYNGTTSEKIDEFIIDTEDLNKVRYHKWRLSHGHVVTGLPSKGTQRELSWVIMGLDNRDEKNKDVVIDYIDGNPKNNRKYNLRICTQGENVINKKFMSNNTIGFIGVSYKKERGTYDPEIRIGYVRCHLGATKTLEEAVYKRLIAEELLFQEYTNEEEHNKKIEFTKNLSQKTKEELEQIVKDKLIAKNLWQ